MTSRSKSQVSVETILRGINSETANRNGRPSQADGSSSKSQRTEAQRDRDRIMYSSAWRRLGGVTQVVTPFEDSLLLHNRLTHSEKVAQVARSIAEVLIFKTENHELLARLGGFSVEVCEAAALAHDIGHPPFGHIGEECLDEIARDQLKLDDGFEGNAQTFRVISIKQSRSTAYEGLDLTFATLAAIAKYPWSRAPRLANHDTEIKKNADYRRHWNKFNAYTEQFPQLEMSRKFSEGLIGAETQTLEASVMDVADDITYAIHDLEDFYLSGSVDTLAVFKDLKAAHSAISGGGSAESPFSKLTAKLALDYPGWYNEKLYLEALDAVAFLIERYFTRQDSLGTGFDEVEPRARSAGSDQIGKYIAAIVLKEQPLWTHGPHIGLGQKEWHEIQILKEITKAYVINGPHVALLQLGQEKILRELVDMLMNWAVRDNHRLPSSLRRELSIANTLVSNPENIGYGKKKFADRGNPNRVFLDFICTLSDAQCISLHDKLSGRRLHKAGLAMEL